MLIVGYEHERIRAIDLLRELYLRRGKELLQPACLHKEQISCLGLVSMRVFYVVVSELVLDDRFGEVGFQLGYGFGEERNCFLAVKRIPELETPSRRCALYEEMAAAGFNLIGELT